MYINFFFLQGASGPMGPPGDPGKEGITVCTKIQFPALVRFNWSNQMKFVVCVSGEKIV